MHFNVRTSDRLILSYGEPAGTPPAGIVSIEATGPLLAQILAGYSGPNGGVALASDGTVTILPPPVVVPPVPLTDQIMAVPDVAAMSVVAKVRARLAISRIVSP